MSVELSLESACDFIGEPGLAQSNNNAVDRIQIEQFLSSFKWYAHAARIVFFGERPKDSNHVEIQAVQRSIRCIQQQSCLISGLKLGRVGHSFAKKDSEAVAIG